MQVPIGNDLGKRTKDIGLRLRIHSEVRPMPIADNAKTHEIIALDIDLLGGELPASSSKGFGVFATGVTT